MRAGVPPSRRCDFPAGEEGREAFRSTRCEWYETATGDSLEGLAPSEQHHLCHEVARRFRTYNDGRPKRAAPPSPPEPTVPLPTAATISEEKEHDWSRWKAASDYYGQYEPPPQMPYDLPQWRVSTDAEQKAMSVAELLAWQQQRLNELEQARTRVKAIRMAAALDAGSQAKAEHNQLSQLIHRIEMDEFRTRKELDSRYVLMSDDDDEVSIDVEAPPDCEDRIAYR